MPRCQVSMHTAAHCSSCRIKHATRRKQQHRNLSPGTELVVVGKGLSRSNTDALLPEKGDLLPLHFTRPVQEAIQNYTCESVSSLSSSGQTTPIDLNNSWSGIQSYTTGLSTERSSVYSWRDDEFDKANTQRVHQLFWDVDEMLFEDSVTSQNINLQAECKDWTRRSLHLRILGKQLIYPKDEGFQHFQCRKSTGSFIAPQSIAERSGSFRQLCVSGSRLVPEASPLQRCDESTSSTSSLGSDSSVYSFLEEEIYGAEGSIEEYLAYDSREHDDEGLDQRKAQLQQKKAWRGIPPVSPNDCIKDAVDGEAFDDIWRTVAECMQELIIKSWEVTTETKKKAGIIQTTSNKGLQPVPRIMSGTIGVPPSRGSEARSMSFASSIFTSQANRNLGNDLNGVMTIQAKPLQHRHAGLVEKTHHSEQEDKSLTISRVTNSAIHRLGKASDNSIISSSRILYTPSRKTPTQRRLPAITLDSMRSRTPNVYSDEVLRGTKLYTGLDRLSSPSIQPIRNKLPPINSETIEQHLSVPGSRHSAQHRGKQPHSRVSSAIPDTMERRPLRERSIIVEQISRPNTTHTFRSETSHRRHFPPMDVSNHTWTGQAFLTSSQYPPKASQRNPPNTRRTFQVPS